MTRPRTDIKVYANPEERARIKALAASANLSVSSYLLAAGLNKEIRSVLDVKAVEEMAKVNGDLGRVAGLLKLWLATKKGEGAHPREVEKMMKEFRELQKKSHEIMGRMVR